MLIESLYNGQTGYLILNEANLFNTKLQYNGISLLKYLTDISSDIGDDNVEKQFINKLSKLLMNDDKFHVAVRELPGDAPDWAKAAFEEKTLMAFAPTPALTDIISNIMHYVSALIENTKHADNNEVVIANRELAGFAKAGSLADLENKANAYYARNSKKVNKSDISGMKHLSQDQEGFEWYLVQTQEAFAREGKVLQNCIGKHYTAATCTRNKESIFVMKTSSGETVVGLRVGEHNVFKEVKGKGNTIPVPKYMTAVLRFMSRFKLDVRPEFSNDLINAGYFVVEGEVVDKGQAVQKLSKWTSMGTENGFEILKLNTKSYAVTMDRTLARVISSGFGFDEKHYSDPTSGIYLTASNKKNASTYVRVIANTIVNFGVIGKLKPTTVRENVAAIDQQNPHNDELGVMLSFLFKHRHVATLSAGAKKSLMLNKHWIVDENSGDIEHIAPNKITLNGKGLHDVHAHTDKRAHRALDTGPDGGGGTRYVAKLDNDADGNTRHLIMKRHASTDVLDGLTANAKPNSTYYNSNESLTYTDPGVKRVGFNHQVRDNKTVNTVVAVANKHEEKLSDMFKWKHGIVTDTDGKHHRIDPHGEVISQTPHVVHYDLTNYNDETADVAVLAILSDSDARTVGHKGVGLSRKSHMNHHVGKHDVVPHTKGGADFHTYRGASDKEERKQLYGGHGYADNIYMIDVNYSNEVHRVAMLVKDKTIIAIDEVTRKHKFKNWGDHEEVVTQLQTVADKNNLTFDKSVATASTSKAIRVVRGKLTTLGEKSSASIERLVKSGKADNPNRVIKLNSGHTAAPMDTAKAAQYMTSELELNSVPGQAWIITDHNGHIDFTMFIKNKQIVRIYGHGPGTTADKLPTKKMGIGPYEEKILKPIIDKLNLTIGDALRKLEDKSGYASGNAMRELLDDAARGYHPGGWVRLEPRQADNGTKRLIKKLEEIGKLQVKRVDDNDLDSDITAYRLPVRGPHADPSVAALVKSQHQIVSDTDDDIDKASSTDVGNTDAKQKENKSGKTPRSGSKAALALTKFRELTTANDKMPTRKEFMAILAGDPFNMSSAAASTYYANTKKKYSQLDEKYSVLASLELMLEEANEIRKPISFKSYMLIG